MLGRSECGVHHKLSLASHMEVLTNLSETLGPNHDPISRWMAMPSALGTADPSFAKQSWWAGQVAEARKARLPELGTARDQVRWKPKKAPSHRHGYQPCQTEP